MVGLVERRLAEAKSQRTAIDARIEELEALLELCARGPGATSPAPSPSRPAGSNVKFAKRPPRRAGHAGSVADTVREHARKAIREAGRPLTRVELLKVVREAGVEIATEMPEKRIGRIMWDSGEFVNVRGAGYWFSGEPVPRPAREATRSGD